MRKSTLWREEYVSQIPAIQLLQRLGYQYLNPEEALSLRGNKSSKVILESVLKDQLQKINSVKYKGSEYDFSENNIQKAVRELTDIPLLGGLVSTSQKAYELLTLGMSLEQTINGDKKSYSLEYIDWHHPENNVYHVTDEFEVERVRSHETRRPDIILFVNGIPLVVIECKRPDSRAEGESTVWDGVSQMLRNQQNEEIPHLFVYAQLLLSMNRNEVLYATTATAKKFWAVWKDEADLEKPTAVLINGKSSAEGSEHLFAHREASVHEHFRKVRATGELKPTEQDRNVYALLRPERLLELAYKFILYDGPDKKVARYQQYFAIQAMLERVEQRNPDGSRKGGVIWHTTGSGKSLTMVMLAKSLALQVKNPKIVLVTDRVDLDIQIRDTFRACGIQPEQAQSGRHLVELLKSKSDSVITTVIGKFETVAQEKSAKDENTNIFVLVDESHRTQYGSMNANMNRVFPNACYIGFTGTPLLKAEKSTAKKFGGIIHKYSLVQATKDKAVVPLLYEGRHALLDVNKAAIDQWFDRVTSGLTDEQKHDLKKKFSRAEAINQAEQRIMLIAYDIARHFSDNFKPNGLKAQVATSSKETALKYKKYLDETNLVTSEVVISAPDTREGNTDIDAENAPEVVRFWRQMMERYKNEETYNKQIVDRFKNTSEEPDLLIVVDKLLTGFDAPRNAVLYLDKPLKDHSLLQAIARVNRLYENKEFGYIIDYRGVLGDLDHALNTYSALEGFDAEDVEGTVTAIQEEIDKLPQRHSVLVSFFRSLPNEKDIEALERYLEDEALRQEFYELLSSFAKSLKIALTSAQFLETADPGKVARYKDDLRHYHNLRVSVMQRYSETVDYSEYEARIKALINRHISSVDVQKLNDPVSIFDKEAFEKELNKVQGAAARADTIASRTKKAISENWDKDPAFYKRFSELIEKAIEEFRQKRIDEVQYLEEITKIYQGVRDKDLSSLPEKLQKSPDAAAYFGILGEVLSSISFDSKEDILADIGLKAESIINAKKIVNWIQNKNIQNEMINELEDYLYSIKGRHDIKLESGQIDEILERLMDVARKRDS